MKTYKHLIIPGKNACYRSSCLELKLKIMEFSYPVSPCGISCRECIYCSTNIESFEEWYNLDLRCMKLKRVMK